MEREGGIGAGGAGGRPDMEGIAPEHAALAEALAKHRGSLERIPVAIEFFLHPERLPEHLKGAAAAFKAFRDDEGRSLMTGFESADPPKAFEDGLRKGTWHSGVLDDFRNSSPDNAALCQPNRSSCCRTSCSSA